MLKNKSSVNPADHLLEPWISSNTSGREGSLPQADPATWSKKDLDNEASDQSPTTSKDVSSSLLEEPQTFAEIGNKGANVTSLHAPLTAPNKPSTTVGNAPKGKVRAAFSESQMNALVQRFSVQRYLTPAEMKNLADLTGLTYKQVRNLTRSCSSSSSKTEFMLSVG